MAQSLLHSSDAAGDAIACDQCQACCCQLQVILMPHDAPPAHLVEVDEHGLDVMRRLDDGWCVALDRDSMRCTIYARRPFVCREFAEGGGDCADVRADWRRIALSLQ